MPPSSTPVASSTAQPRIINPLEVPDWDAKIAQLPGATIFHTAAWARVLTETYRFTPLYFTQTGASGALEAVLPVMEVDSWLTGRRGVSLPFTDECPLLCSNRDSFSSLFEAARNHGLARKWKYLECRGGRKHLTDTPVSTSFLGHRLTLTQDTKALFNRFEPAVRRAVRKGDCSGLVIEFARDEASTRAFYKLLCLTRKRHGVPPQPYRFFAAIQQHLLAQGLGWVVLARYLGEPVAGAVYLHTGRTALYKFGASNEAYQHLRANNLVMARAIDWYASNGFSSFDFGRTSVHNNGLRKFKLGWGAEETHVEYVRLAPKTGRYLSAPDAADSAAMRIFQHLPIPLSRLIGSVLYRHAA